MTNEPDPLFFTAETPLDCIIRVTVAYWEIITQIKHPIMAGQEAEVQATLNQPD
jgi:hypothetical protein